MRIFPCSVSNGNLTQCNYVNSKEFLKWLEFVVCLRYNAYKSFYLPNKKLDMLNVTLIGDRKGLNAACT